MPYRLKLDLRKDENRLLFLLLSADLIFFIFHFVHLYIGKYPSSSEIVNVFKNDVFSIGLDLGLAEAFQYVKEYWIALMFILMIIHKFELIYLNMSLLFIYMELDDMLSIHEHLGGQIGSYFANSQIFSLRAQDIGELIVYSFVGFLFVFLLTISYYRSNNDIRRKCRRLIVLLILFGIFAVGLDMIDGVFKKYKYIYRIMTFLEDGGEMIIMSFICSYVFGLSREINSVKSS